MNRTVKVSLIIIGIFVINVLISCWGHCPKEIIEFDYTGVNVSNVDNTSNYSHTTHDSVMPRKAVAFYVITKSNIDEGENSACFYQPFSSCLAFSRNCPPNFISRQHLTSIQILTLQTLYDTIPANSDVTHLFGAKPGSWGQLNPYSVYDKVSDIERTYKEGGSNQYDIISFYLFLMVVPTEDSVQFNVSLSFDNNSEFSVSTQVIQLY